MAAPAERRTEMAPSAETLGKRAWIVRTEQAGVIV